MKRDSLVVKRKLLEAEISAYSKRMKKTAQEFYGSEALVPAEQFFRILGGRGKRLRGILTMIGYEMCGGKDVQMIVQAARAMEMIHTYLLIIDDIQDKSDTRRNQPSVHKHIGEPLAINAALFGQHAAQMTLANLLVSDEQKVAVLNILNRTMVATVHGQTKDLVFSQNHTATPEEVELMYRHKTAEYTFLNALHTGMVLAGADCHDTDAITDFAIHAGIAYQIKNDLKALHSLQTAQDDIVGGKHTLVIAHAMVTLSPGDKKQLLAILGSDLSKKSYQDCIALLTAAGSISFASERASWHTTMAEKALNKQSSRWPTSYLTFLQGIVEDFSK